MNDIVSIQQPDVIPEKGSRNLAEEVKIYPFENPTKPATPSLAEWKVPLFRF